jgi:Bifunctional DNA primase/polymerase, N-terminal/AAA domain
MAKRPLNQGIILLKSPNFDAAVRHAAAGFRVIPLEVFQNAEGQWKKRPYIRDWQEKATTDPRTLEQWWSEFPDALPGIELGSAGLVVIDSDRHNPEENGVAAFAELRKRHSDHAPHPRTLTAGNGQRHFYRQPPGRALGNGQGSLPKGINIRGAGGLVVAPGAVRPDGAIWESDRQAPDLRDAFREGSVPEVPAWLVEILRPRNRAEFAVPSSEGAACTPREQAYAAATLEEVCNELATTAVGHRNNRLNATAYRLGRMVARGWLEDSDVKSRLRAAAGANGLASNDGRASVEETIDSGFKAGLARPHDDLKDRGASELGAPLPSIPSPPLIPIYWDGDAPINLTKWLVRDVIPIQASGLLVGESRAGKTFLALDLARALSRGGYFLTKSARTGGTLYLAAEAPNTIQGRLTAARLGPLEPFLDENGNEKATGQKPKLLSVATILEVPDLLTDQGMAQLVATALDVSEQMQQRFGVPLRLIVIDTMLAAFNIQDWNNPAQTGKVMNALAKIAKATDTVVLGIHHHGKDITRGAAGSFALTAASDFVLSVFAEMNTEGAVSNRHLSVTKLRDAPTGWSCGFDLRPFKIGTDDEGQAINSAFVEPILGGLDNKPGPKKTKAPSQAVSIFMETLDEALKGKGEDRIIPNTGETIRMARISDVRASFGPRYKSATRTPKSPDAQRCRPSALVGQNGLIV